MKLQTKYKSIKMEYNDYLILIKSGNFYITFLEDAYILNYIFGYQIKNNKVGFPIKSLDKVLETLKEKKINVLVDNLNITCNENRYNDYLICSNKNYIFEESLNNLFNEIKIVVNNDIKKVNEIRRMVNEL